jgi:hypothetical protein
MILELLKAIILEPWKLDIWTVCVCAVGQAWQGSVKRVAKACVFLIRTFSALLGIAELLCSSAFRKICASLFKSLPDINVDGNGPELLWFAGHGLGNCVTRTGRTGRCKVRNDGLPAPGWALWAKVAFTGSEVWLEITHCPNLRRQKAKTIKNHLLICVQSPGKAWVCNMFFVWMWAQYMIKCTCV